MTTAARIKASKPPRAVPGGADILARAERVCAERGLRLTIWRRLVLKELASASAPLGAYEIAHRLRGTARVSVVTVYRVLDFLIEVGLVHKVASQNTYFPCRRDHLADELTVFLICASCGSVQERNSAALAGDLNTTAGAVRFKPTSRTIELTGECRSCAGGEDASSPVPKLPHAHNRGAG